MNILRFFTFALVGIVLALPAQAAKNTNYMLHSIKAGYSDVRQDLEDAIVNRGYVVDFKGSIGDMLARTRKDVGSSKELYKNAEFMIFCSAKLSRTTMEADPHNIAFCPYAITVYELAAQPGTVYVSHRNLGSTGSKPLTDIHDVLHAIAMEVTK